MFQILTHMMKAVIISDVEDQAFVYHMELANLKP